MRLDWRLDQGIYRVGEWEIFDSNSSKLLVTYKTKAPSKKSGRRDNDCNGSQRLAAQRLGKADAASLPYLFRASSSRNRSGHF